MVVRPMPFRSIPQCDKTLDFEPRLVWPRALPAYAWQGILLSGFERREGEALDLFQANGCSWLEAMTACYPSLGLAELARLTAGLRTAHPELKSEYAEGLFAAYGLRWCERLQDTMAALAQTPMEFQEWVDDKKVGARDLAPLLALPAVADFTPFLRALLKVQLSKSQATQALELGVELFLLEHPLTDLLPNGGSPESYLARLENWRRPKSGAHDEKWRQTVTAWPWPAQVQGQWQRFGDQAGLEIKIRTTSPADFHKKLERLNSIRDTWSCNT